MIIKLHGETSLPKLPKVLREVIDNIQERAGLSADKIRVKDVQVGVVLTVEGEEKIISVTHDNVTEMFQVHVKLDKKGDISMSKDNEEESFLDDYSKAIAKGEQPSAGTEEIESSFDDADLEFLYEENGGDLVAEYFRNKKEDMNVIRYYRNGVLVGESGYIPKYKKEA